MKDMAIALGIHNRNRKMAKGGEVKAPHVEHIAKSIMNHPDASSIVDAIMEKKAMCDGGMMAEGGEVESQDVSQGDEMESLSSSGDDFLSDDSDNPSDVAKDSNVDDDKKQRMAEIMASIRAK